ncbi:hypothetical protein SEA_GODPHATHER_89 [Mycobacterium phage GodPhather]|uniref:C2H2-type domain-containing protein n=1 Tax=Mycobacterium phage Jeon TaxID=2108123 RepID=A0A2P1JRL4_9CAUD|nr:hypothetical protein PQB70_gp70 [Mycobacterium phage Jeon]AVO21785.1 hypothetical protein SEA_JEON_83 [Mycobacterium phage Jeon]QBP32659.1 hypothetical protein SEA_GODPHATHER_89 [Mycobacterium phage GodPhather]
MSEIMSAAQKTITDATCAGCGKTFKGARGLKSHQTSRNVTMACKPVAEPVAEVAEAEVVQVADNVTVYSNVDAALAYLEAEYPELRGEQADDVVEADDADEDQGEPVVEAAADEPIWKTIADEARIYSTIPEDVRTALVKIDGRDKWALRWHSEDAIRLAKSSESCTIVKVTRHEAGGETVVTDFHWADGTRARMTEKFSV